MIVLDLVMQARDRFLRAGIDRPQADLDAELLARELLGWDRARFLTDRHEEAPAEFEERYVRLVARRERREPLAHIVGHREFWGLHFEVSRHVLVPRPETELIVEEALACLKQPGQISAPAIVDVGTGSGCLAVALARELPEARVTAIDLSPAALDIARRNAARHGVADRIEFRQGQLLGGVSGAPDLIVSNPPYVAETAAASLPPEVRDHEPQLALVGGPDGLDTIRELVAQAETRLTTGWLIFEFGMGQEEAVRSIVRRTGLRLLRIRKDLQGIPRTAVVASADRGA